MLGTILSGQHCQVFLIYMNDVQVCEEFSSHFHSDSATGAQNACGAPNDTQLP